MGHSARTSENFLNEPEGFHISPFALAALDDKDEDDEEDDDQYRHSKTRLKPGMWISEATLWMQWHARGALTAPVHSILFALDSKLLARVFSEYEGSGAYATAVMYACSFAKAMQRLHPLSDV